PRMAGGSLGPVERVATGRGDVVGGAARHRDDPAQEPRAATSPLRSVEPLHVPHVGGHPGGKRVRAADQLDLRCDLEVVELGTVAAIAADELVRVGIPALRLAADDADRLPPQGDGPELAGFAHSSPPCTICRWRMGQIMTGVKQLVNNY